MQRKMIEVTLNDFINMNGKPESIQCILRTGRDNTKVCIILETGITITRGMFDLIELW